jgi:hypothetical protein
MSSFALDLASQPTTPSTELKQSTAVTNMLHRAHPEDSLSAGEMSQVVGRGHLAYAPQVFRLDLSRPCRHWSDQGEHGREDGCDQSKPRLHREYPEAWTKRRTGDVPFGAIAKGRLTPHEPQDGTKRQIVWPASRPAWCAHQWYSPSGESFMRLSP